MTAVDPKISLAIDNCYASKHWIEPAAYSEEQAPGMPPQCGAVTLTLEPFISTSAFIPEDGMRLSEIIKNIGGEGGCGL